MRSANVPRESASDHLAGVPTARKGDTASAVLARLPGSEFDSLDVICVVGDGGELLGTVRPPDVFRAPPDAPVESLMDAEAPRVGPDEDQERVAGLAVRHGVASVPVVDEAGRLLGAVPARALLEILRREHVEDLHHLAGIRRENWRARHALEVAPARRAHDRLPWLLVGLLGSVLATFVVSRFEHVLESRIAVSFFVPGIVYLADAIGTQTEAIAVRGLSLSHGPFRRLLAGELWTGTLIGSCLGALAFPVVLLAFDDVRLAAAVAIAILCAGAMATTIGLFLPWVLSARGGDPALGSGPVATIIQDVLSLVIYFVTAQLLLG
jgi:magnesium transporter